MNYASEVWGRSESQRSGAVTVFLEKWSKGNDEGLKEALPLVYEELRNAARHHLEGEAIHHTLQPTALISEVYLRLRRHKKMHFESRNQFLWFAGQLMRRILVEHARTHQAQKRGSGNADLAFDEALGTIGSVGPDTAILIALDTALKRLEKIDPCQSKIVELRFFAGLNIPETAEVMNTSPSTIKREWRIAKKWLARELGR